MYDIEHYYKAQSVSDAVRRLSESTDARLIAGGTDVLIQLHHMNKKFRNLVDIHGLPELCGISQLDDGSIRIGSGSTFTQIIEAALVKRYLPSLGQAVANIAGPQVRNEATFGGNICNGANCADSSPISIVLGAQIEIATPDCTRFTPLESFYTGPGKVALAHNEVAVAFHFKPEDFKGVGASFYKYAMRGAMDISTINCGAACRIEAGRFTMLKLAYGVAAPTPIRAKAAEAAALGQPFNAVTLAAVREAVVQDVAPRTSWRASKEFRMQIIRTLAERVVAQAAKNAGGTLA